MSESTYRFGCLTCQMGYSIGYRREGKVLGQKRHGIIFILVFLTLFFTVISNAWAVPNDPPNTLFNQDQPVQFGETSNSQGQALPATAEFSWFAFLLRLILSLSFILLLTYLALRFLGRNWNRRMNSRWLRVLDQMSFGPNKGIYIAELAGRIFVLGVSEHNITPLVEIEDSEMQTRLRDEGEEQQESLPWSRPKALEKFRLWVMREERKNPLPENDFHHVMQGQLQKLHNLSDGWDRGFPGGPGKESKDEKA